MNHWKKNLTSRCRSIKLLLLLISLLLPLLISLLLPRELLLLLFIFWLKTSSPFTSIKFLPPLPHFFFFFVLSSCESQCKIFKLVIRNRKWKEVFKFTFYPSKMVMSFKWLIDGVFFNSFNFIIVLIFNSKKKSTIIYIIINWSSKKKIYIYIYVL